MSDHVYNVLFLCTGNSARSIMAESMLNKLGRGRFRAFSAGSDPRDTINPIALRLLKEMEFPTEGLRSKSWDEFAAPRAPVLDFVFTVCDNAAGEVCPAWPGQPMTAHWGIEDPAAIEGPEIDKEKAFVTAMRYLRNRLGVFINLPIESLDDLTLGKQLREIGRQTGASQPRPNVA
jgi:arsenate reductase